MQFLGEHGATWHLASTTASVNTLVPKSLVVADAGVFAEARRRRAMGELPLVVVSLPRWKAISAGFLGIADAGQGELGL